MDAFWKFVNGFILFFLILLCFLGTFYRHISFGWGLGDILGYLILYGGTFVHLIATILSYKKGKHLHLVLSLGSFAFLSWVVLSATIWRGPEYRWNGSLFYLPCPTNIEIRNGEYQKGLLIKMCTGDYTAQFEGEWNGSLMINVKGEIEIPKEVDKYLAGKLERVFIKPQTRSLIRQGELFESNVFDLSDLELGERYKLEGKLSGIRDGIPIMEVRLK